MPQHIAELYNKQMALWEQVSRRSSLSALSLASTTPRYGALCSHFSCLNYVGLFGLFCNIFRLTVCLQDNENYNNY